MQMVSRRSFIKNTSTAGLGLWLGFSANGQMVKASGTSAAKNFSPFILIEPDGRVTIFNIKPEMGQGTFQSVPALMAEELEVAPDQINVVSTNGEKEFGGGQSAGGSSSIRTNYTRFRKTGAAAREVLIQAAATKWQVNPADCYAENGRVINRATSKSFGYGELLEDAAKLELPKDPKLKDPKDFKILGKAIKRPDTALKTCGKAEFGIDAKVDGMLYASVEHSPVLGGTVQHFDVSEAMQVPGVVKVLETEKIMGRYRTTGVAVIANSYWAATQGRKKLKITWDNKGFETFNSTEYENKLRSLANEDGLPDKKIGSPESLNPNDPNTIEAFYETPMVAHHTMEPMNCMAYAQGDKLEIWTSTQVPGNLMGTGPNDFPKLVGFAPENITLHNKFIGGGFGRRLYVDYIIEAVNIAKQIDRPVKLIWSREDTTQQGPFRPMTFSKLRGAVDESGRLNSFQHKVISPSLSEATRPNFDPTKADGTMVEGIGTQAYEIPNLQTSYVRVDFHVPLAAWRSVTSSTLAFPHECFIDELAFKAKKDPLDFRLNMLTQASDTKRVLTKLREVSGWDKPLPKGKGRGVAQWEFFAGLCAHAVEVSWLPDKSIKIDRVVAVIDLGEVVNPDNVKNQVEGGIVMAIGAATKAGITLENGIVAQHNFYDSPIPRINEAPTQIDVYILAEGGKVKGVGEPGLPPLAPALGNAIFAATGIRLRKMPFDLTKVG